LIVDSSSMRLIEFGTKTPAMATNGPLPIRAAQRIHLPLAPTSILAAVPFCDTSSKNRAGGSEISWIGARGSAWNFTSTPLR
jgi:hypothetical protein